MTGAEEPIGYWVKRIDTLLEAALDRVLAGAGVRRRHWQVLSVLRDGPRTRAEVAESMLAFWVAASVTQTDVVDDLVRRGWARIEADRYVLTDDGAGAHARIWADVDALRALVTDGFTATENAALLDALARMAANLERGPDRPGPAMR